MVRWLGGHASTEGLDRFADFFRAPIFDSDSVAAEVHAINSEHEKNKQDPSWRTLQLMYSLSNPESVVGRFHTGDADTLYENPKTDGVDPQVALRNFFNSHYCPNRMQVVTFSSDSLDDQLQIATEKFGKIQARGAACHAPVLLHTYSDRMPFPNGTMGKYVTALGTESEGQLWMHFHLPSTEKEFVSQPLQYIFWVLEYGGEDSLSRVLKDHVGLATSVRVFNDQSSMGTELFMVLSLTEAGRSHPGL